VQGGPQDRPLRSYPIFCIAPRKSAFALVFPRLKM
jgi:hypothetical protein